MRSILRRRPSPAMAVALVALFVAMSGVAYAANTIRSRDIVNDAVTSADIKGGGGKTGDVKNRDVNKSLAVAKGFATVDASTGQRREADPERRRSADREPARRHHRHADRNRSVHGDVQRQHRNGQVLGGRQPHRPRHPGHRPATPPTAMPPSSRRGSSANENQVVLRVQIRNNANTLIDRDFSLQFYANE